jgi:hypothetical protein
MRFLRNNPLILLAVAAVGFGAWVLSDLLGTREPLSTDPPNVTAVQLIEPPTPPPADWHGPGVVTPDMVPQLKPGMSRSEVEALIGPPPAQMVSPVTETDGRLTYRASYLANLDVASAPATPPPLSRRQMPPPPAVPKSLIALEFDASKPGHPLVRVHYPDPLF